MAAAAPLIAGLYGDQSLVDLCRVLSLTFLLNGMSAQYVADLTRNLRFVSTVVVTVGSQAVGLAVGIVAAVAGPGHLALGILSVGSSAAALVLAVTFAGWLPGPYHPGLPMRSFFRFGGGMLGAQLLGAAAYQAHSVVLGTSLGAAQLGTYSRAYQLVTLPLNQIQSPATRVALPVLSRAQDEPPRLMGLLLRGQTLLLHTTAFVVAAPSALAPVLIPLVLGDHWSDVSAPFRVLSLAAIATMGSYVCYWIYLALGLTGRYFTFSIWSRPLMIAAVVLGGQWGVLGVAVAYTAAVVALWPLNYWWLARFCEIPVWRLFANATRIAAIHIAVAVAGGLVLQTQSRHPPMLALMVSGVAMLFAYLVLAVGLRSFRSDLRSVADLARRR
jgi:PST family polysaccharide transporter